MDPPRLPWRCCGACSPGGSFGHCQNSLYRGMLLCGRFLWELPAAGVVCRGMLLGNSGLLRSFWATDAAGPKLVDPEMPSLVYIRVSIQVQGRTVSLASETYSPEHKIGSWGSGMRLRDWFGLASMGALKRLEPSISSDSLASFVTKTSNNAS